MRLPWFSLFMLTACGATTTTSDGGALPLTPGAAGTGHLGYIVETPSGRELEVVNLGTAKVEYRSREADGEVVMFFLSADGSTAVFRSAQKPCVKVALSSGVASDCTPAGLELPFVTGVSADGARLSFTGSRPVTYAATRAVLEAGTVTLLDDPGADGNTQVSGGGGLSPDGEFLYEFRFVSAGLNPPLTLVKYPRSGGAPTVVFDATADVHASNIADLELQQSEGGTRGLFSCFDPTQARPAEGLSTCAVDLVSGAVTLLPNAVGALALDGSKLVTVPPFSTGYRVYDFGGTTPVATVTRSGGSVALSPDGTRFAYRMDEDDAFFVAATVPVAGGVPVRVQRDDFGSRATPEFLRWVR